MSGAQQDDGKFVSGARDRFLESENVDDTAVRGTILASWRRSQFWGVPVDELTPPYRPDTEIDSRLVHAARPVMDRLEAALAGAPMSVILTDAHACVLDRRAGEPSLNKHLDMILLAPGFSYAEQFVGTNGIGTALEARQSSRVFGSEHFSERLQSMSCAGTPIRNLLNGRVEGVIDLTSWRANASLLMQAMSQEAAAEIEQLLVHQSSEREQALLLEFLAVNRRTAKAVLAVGDDIVMTNEVADRALDRADHLILRERAAGTMSGSHDASGEVVLSRGQMARIRCRPVASAIGTAGAIIEITLGEVTPRHHATGTLSAEPLADLAGHSAEWIEASKQVEAHCRARSWLLVAGESGVGKFALIQAAHRRWYPDQHLNVLDALELADDVVKAWLARNAGFEETPGTLVLRHVDQMSPAALGQLDAVLQMVDHSPPGPWVVGTVQSDTDMEERLGKLFQHFTESVPVPPLRHRIEDLRELVPHFLRRHAPGRRIAIAPDAMQTLFRGAWPGNVAELERALRSALARRHTGQITVADLPDSCHATSRGVLSEWECIERDAITRALRDSNGDKIKAAVRLGISRATIYRKIRTFGIIIESEPSELREVREPVTVL
jgi:sigma-54 dependent transcriptional regulator, acetoin dehydrogenase operon transcriptional activator AcoR